MNRVQRDSKKYSSFWLKDDLFDDVDDGLNVVETKHSNLMALASYKKSIGNFVNIVTNDNIPVTKSTKPPTAVLKLSLTLTPKSVITVAICSKPNFSNIHPIALVTNSTKPPINPSTIPVTAPLIPSRILPSF